MELETDTVLAKMARKPERRRSSLFSLLKRKKFSRQYSEPVTASSLSLNRKFSVDSAILSDFAKVQNGYKTFLEKTPSQDDLGYDGGWWNLD